MISKLTAVAAAVACAAAVAGTAIAGTVAPTDVTIREQNGDFHGRVVSPVPECYDGRTVALFKVRKGKDLKINSDTADEDGKWNTGNTHVGKGRYYAKARGISFSVKRGVVGCDRDKSRVVTVD